MSGYRNFDEQVDKIEKALEVGVRLLAERDALQAEVERLRDADVVPGALAQRFKDERNIARVRVEQLEQTLKSADAVLSVGGGDYPRRREAHGIIRAALHPDQRGDTCPDCDGRRVRGDVPGSVGGCAPCLTCRKTDALKQLMEFGKRLMNSDNEDERGIGWCICEGARIIEEGSDDVQS